MARWWLFIGSTACWGGRRCSAHALARVSARMLSFRTGTLYLLVHAVALGGQIGVDRADEARGRSSLWHGDLHGTLGHGADGGLAGAITPSGYGADRWLTAPAVAAKGRLT